MSMIAKAFSEGVKQALRLIKGGAINGQTASKAAETVMKNMDKSFPSWMSWVRIP
jgi:hypothetical protein